MAETATHSCPRCGDPHPERMRRCPSCGHAAGAVVREPVIHETRAEEFAETWGPAEIAPAQHRHSHSRSDSHSRIGEGWIYLGIGALCAPVFSFTPMLRYMGWFLSSLVHETGHTAAAWLVGCPAVPAIRLDGHAWATHRDQVLLLALVVWALIVYLTWTHRAHRWVRWWGCSLALLHPLVAFTGARESFFLVAGHLGELAFTGVFFYRALTGGFTNSNVERGLYSTLGWCLLGHNVWLTGGLLFSDSVRQWYASSGSLGMANDYIRLGGKLGWTTGNVAFVMLLVCLAVLPLALWAAVRSRAASATS